MPADDVGRKMAVKAAREGLEEAGMEGFEQAVRRSVGDDLAEQVFRQMDLEDALIGGICFEAGTPVAAAEGLTPIETVEVSDLVWAADLGTGVMDTFTVTKVFSHPVQSLLEVVIGNDLIRVTEEHPFWVTGEGWVGAEALEPGDCVRTLAGTCQAVVSIQLVSADTWVYNLTVATAHTYFVGDGQWLVHNRCGARGPLADKIDDILRKFRHSDFFAGGEKFSITKERMCHILSRHHPDFWDGSGKATQTFFDSALSVDDVIDLAQQTVQGGYSTRIGSNSRFTYEAVINGITYRARTQYGKLVQFHPLP
jgi:hypothetical protein